MFLHCDIVIVTTNEGCSKNYQRALFGDMQYIKIYKNHACDWNLVVFDCGMVMDRVVRNLVITSMALEQYLKTISAYFIFWYLVSHFEWSCLLGETIFFILNNRCNFNVSILYLVINTQYVIFTWIPCDHGLPWSDVQLITCQLKGDLEVKLWIIHL